MAVAAGQPVCGTPLPLATGLQDEGPANEIISLLFIIAGRE